MDKTKKEKIAIFRYGVIFPLIDCNNSWGDKENILKSIVEKEWDIPYSDKTYLCRATIINWLKKYRDGGKKIESLYPKDRLDRGFSRALNPEIIDALVKLRMDYPQLTIQRLIEKSMISDIFTPEKIPSVSTIYRLLKKHNSKIVKKIEDMRKFEVEMTNDLWQTDCMHGPKVYQDGKLQKSYLFAIIDDHSRLITHGQFYLAETLDNFLDCFWIALNKRGVPRKVYTDNGASFRSHRLQLGCADLGIGLSYAKPYRPQGKGKIERFFRTVRSQFLPELPENLSLEKLNTLFFNYINNEYHKRKHGTTGETPIDRYQKSAKLLRSAPKNLPLFFRKHAIRTVNKDRTIKINNRVFEAPHGLVGHIVSLRYEELDRIEVFLEDRSMGYLTEVNVVVNSRIGREKSVDNSNFSGGQLFSKGVKNGKY